MAEWKPIETALKDGTRIDIWGYPKDQPNQKGGRVVDIFWSNSLNGWSYYDVKDDMFGLIKCEPKFWVEIPEDPAQ